MAVVIFLTVLYLSLSYQDAMTEGATISLQLQKTSPKQELFNKSTSTIIGFNSTVTTASYPQSTVVTIAPVMNNQTKFRSKQEEVENTKLEATAPDSIVQNQSVPNSTFRTRSPIMNNVTTFDSTVVTLTFTASKNENYSTVLNKKSNASENNNNTTLNKTHQFSSMDIKQFKFPPFLLRLLTMNPLTLITNIFNYILLVASAQRTFIHNRRKFVHNLITGLVRNSLIARVLNLVRSHILFRLQSGGVFRRLYYWWENRRFAPFRNTVRKLWGLRPMVKARELVGVLLDDMWNATKLFNYLRKHVPPGRFWGGLIALRSLIPLPILLIGLHVTIRHVKLETIEIILEQFLDNGLFIIINQIVKGAKIGFTSD